MVKEVKMASSTQSFFEGQKTTSTTSPAGPLNVTYPDYLAPGVTVREGEVVGDPYSSRTVVPSRTTIRGSGGSYDPTRPASQGGTRLEQEAQRSAVTTVEDERFRDTAVAGPKPAIERPSPKPVIFTDAFGNTFIQTGAGMYAQVPVSRKGKVLKGSVFKSYSQTVREHEAQQKPTPEMDTNVMEFSPMANMLFGLSQDTRVASEEYGKRGRLRRQAEEIVAKTQKRASEWDFGAIAVQASTVLSPYNPFGLSTLYSYAIGGDVKTEFREQFTRHIESTLTPTGERKKIAEFLPQTLRQSPLIQLGASVGTGFILGAGIKGAATIGAQILPKAAEIGGKISSYKPLQAGASLAIGGVIGAAEGVKISQMVGAGATREQVLTEVSKDFINLGGFAGGFGGGLREGTRLEFIGKRFIPEKKIIDPQVLKGKEVFPQFPEGVQTVPKGIRKKTSLQLEREFKTTSQPKELAPKKGVLTFHTTKARFGAEEIVARGYSETPGLYVAPKASPHFLRLGKVGYPSPGPIKKQPFKLTERPKIVAITVKDVRQVPERYVKTPRLEPSSKFILERAERGLAYIAPARRVVGKAEKEAIIPPETKLTREDRGLFDLESFKIYTRVGGKFGEPVPVFKYKAGGDKGKVLTPKEITKIKSESRLFAKESPRGYPSVPKSYPSVSRGLSSGRVPSRPSTPSRPSKPSRPSGSSVPRTPSRPRGIYYSRFSDKPEVPSSYGGSRTGGTSAGPKKPLPYIPVFGADPIPGMTRKALKLPKKKYKYFPSVTALLGNIRGKALEGELLTGMELRPIPNGGKKKKKKVNSRLW